MTHQNYPLPSSLREVNDLSLSERRVLAAVVGRWRDSTEEDAICFGDCDCLADDIGWDSDVVGDTLHDLEYRGLVVGMACALFVPTDRGVRFAAAIERQAQHAQQ